MSHDHLAKAAVSPLAIRPEPSPAERRHPARMPLPRLCASCGRGLSGATRAAPDPEDRLRLALFAPFNLCGWRSLCTRCAPIVIARTKEATR